MRRVLIYVILLVGILSSCERRILLEADYTVNLNISINKDITNYVVEKDPSIMRCVFYDSETGGFVTQAFLPPTGGQVSLVPARTYDVLVYNFDTESTWLKEENWFHKIYASTSLIPDSYKTKLRSRSTDSKVDEENIVYDPDHLFVGRLNDVFIPARSVEATAVDININAESVVESWVIDITTITGTENVGSVVGVVTGLVEHNKIGLNERSNEFVSVYFDTPVLGDDGRLTARFNTFGYNQDSSEPQILTLVFTDIAGNDHHFDFDISDQFKNNEHQVISIGTDEVDIPKPMTSGSGGFVPKVDEWESVDTEIRI